MKLKKRSLFFCLLLLHLTAVKLMSSDVLIKQDTLAEKTYNYLKTNSRKYVYQNKGLSLLYAKGYLKKAKASKNTDHISQGYHLMFLSAPTHNAFSYTDSLLAINPEGKYRALGYCLKARYFYQNRNFKDALDNYLVAYGHIKDHDTVKLKYVIELGIGILQSRIGNPQRSLQISKSSLKYFKENKNWDEYLATLWSMTGSHIELKNIDSAKIYNRKGIALSKKLNSHYYNFFVLTSGMNQYIKGNYSSSIDSINKALTYIEKVNNIPNIAVGNYYLGLSSEKLGRFDKAIMHYKKVDTIFMQTGDIYPPLRPLWEKLIDYYKKQDDTQNQLLYITKLLRVDSILNDNYKYLNRNIGAKYDIPQLLLQKDNLISRYQNSSRTNSRNTYIFITLFLFAATLFFYYRFLEKKKIENYKRIIDQISKGSVQRKPTKSSPINLDAQKIDAICKALDDFEKKQHYLDSKISLSMAAKKCQTNTKYLSMYINHFQGSNFKQYINDLRIGYTLGRLKKDTTFRKWTVRAIGKEVGFNNIEYFAKAFRKKTGIKPAYFISKLESDHIS